MNEIISNLHFYTAMQHVFQKLKEIAKDVGSR
jgi:hypothetical protein